MHSVYYCMSSQLTISLLFIRIIIPMHRWNLPPPPLLITLPLALHFFSTWSARIEHRFSVYRALCINSPFHRQNSLNYRQFNWLEFHVGSSAWRQVHLLGLLTGVLVDLMHFLLADHSLLASFAKNTSLCIQVHKVSEDEWSRIFFFSEHAASRLAWLMLQVRVSSFISLIRGEC